MSVAMSAAAAAARSAGFAGSGFTAAARSGKGGKLLGQLRRTAVRTFRALPVRRADEEFTIAFALPAMKFVNRHGLKLGHGGKNSSASVPPMWFPNAHESVTNSH